MSGVDGAEARRSTGPTACPPLRPVHVPGRRGSGAPAQVPPAAPATPVWASLRPAPSAFARVPIDESSNLNQLATAAGAVNALDAAVNGRRGGDGIGVGGGVAVPRQLMEDALALLLGHTWTRTDRHPGIAPAPAPLGGQAPAVGPPPGNAPAPIQGGQVQSIGTAALQSRVPSELAAALAAIVSGYWSHATHELQLDSARNSSVHAALAFAQEEGTASKAESKNLEESNKSLRLQLSTLQKIHRAAHEKLATAGAELGNTRAELGHTRAELVQLRAELVQLRAELGQTRAERGQTRTELGATRTEHETTLAKANATWNALCRARDEIAGTQEELAAAVANGERLNVEVQLLRENVALWTTRAKDTGNGFVAARADRQSLRSGLAAEVAQGTLLRSELAAAEAATRAQAAAGEGLVAEIQSLRRELEVAAEAARAQAAAEEGPVA